MLHVKALISGAAGGRSRCSSQRLDGCYVAAGTHLRVVLPHAARVLPAHTAPLAQNAFPLSRRQRNGSIRIARPFCTPSSSSFFFFFGNLSICWIVPLLTKPDSSLPARQLLSGPRDSGSHGGSSDCFSDLTNAEKGEKFR